MLLPISGSQLESSEQIFDKFPNSSLNSTQSIKCSKLFSTTELTTRLVDVPINVSVPPRIAA